jgi:sulfite reductase (NADPH) flavoprotein alpha-component
MIWTSDPTRLALLAALSCSYTLVCLAPWLRARRQRQAARADRAQLARASIPPWLVAWASQTGNAELLAEQTAGTLRLAGIPVRVLSLGAITADDLMRSERLLLLASTYGEGDAPDNAAAFVSRVMAAPLAPGARPLGHLHFGLLALGDRGYTQFCGFGQALEQWLVAQGAAPLFAAVEVDRSAMAAIDVWRQHLSHLAGTSDAPDWGAPAFADWRLTTRRRINGGSAGAPLYHLELEPLAGPLPAWQSGDLVQVAAPADPDHPREYSIASVMADGRVHLLVRLHRHQDGGAGLASGWLTTEAALGQTLQLRLRQHRRFRLEANATRPLLLIGNGSGMAGLRGHLKARVAAGVADNWLLFGERNAASDYHYRDELTAWQAAGMLPRLSLAFSRDQAERLYVQHLLLAEADDVRAWVTRGAAIYICGSLSGMAGAVDAALATILGRAGLDTLAAEGRYRRDVY